MRKVSVEVLEDASHPEGGYAVLLLRDVASLPDATTFRLKPVEARGSFDDGETEAWPQGDLIPRAVRRVTGGMELLVGPDVVECRALVPGAIGVLEVKAAGVRGEFLWPSIKPTARPRRRNLTVVKPSRASAGVGPRAAGPSGGTSSTASSLDTGMQAALAGQGTARGEADLAPLYVTALDHDIAAAPSIAEAMGGNVVKLNVQREKETPAATDGAGPGGENDGGHAKPMGSRRLSARLDIATRRTVAIAAGLVMTVSAGALMVSRKPHVGEQVAVAANADAAKILSRAEAMPAAVTVELAERVTVQRGAAGDASASSQSAPMSGAPAVAAGVAPADQPDTQPVHTEPAGDVAPVGRSSPLAEVTLRMRGGGFQISGELKGFDGTKYIIATRSAGELTMDASRFECFGDPCGRPASTILPLSERPSPVKPDVFRIEGAPALGGEFIAQLIRDYAQSIGATLTIEPRDAGKTTRYRILDTRGTDLASIEVAATGSANGLQALERGAAAIALVDRPLVAEAEPRSVSVARPRPRQVVPVQPSEIPVGLDAIVGVVGTRSPLASITLDNLVKVAAGQITDWYELGLSPGPITLYLPQEGAGSLDAFSRQVLKPRGLDFARNAKRLSSEADAADAAAKDPRGIAVVSLAAQREARAVNLELQCGLVVRPTSFTVKTGEYPLLRRLSLQLAPQLAQPSARGLIRVAQSGEVGNALLAGRIVDQSLASLPLEEQAERMAWAANAPPSAFDAAELRQMLTDLSGAARLSMTFRFVAGTNELDQRSRREVLRLAAALRQPELAGKRIILAGFTDGAGRFQVNLAASARRAAQVRSALLSAAPALDGRLLQSKGYGPLAPVGCNSTPEGARLNRRVEVWVAW